MNVLPNIPNTMNIVEYNNVDPMSVLHLTMLALDFPFTPEHAAHIRRTDPRPFPCFTVNAVEDDKVLGQVGIFRLPMISTQVNDIASCSVLRSKLQKIGSLP